MTRPTFEDLLESKVQISLINEPIEPPPLTVREMVKRRWQVDPRVIEGRKEPVNVD
jgi:hypothetical protein